MLVLSRKTGERIQIGSDITITVVRINAHAVRIGVDAPSDLEIVREELSKGVAIGPSDSAGSASKAASACKAAPSRQMAR